MSHRESVMEKIHRRDIQQRLTFDNLTVFEKCMFNSDGVNIFYMHFHPRHYQELLGIDWEHYDIIDLTIDTNFNHTTFQLHYPFPIIGYYLYLLEGWGQRFLHLYVFLVNNPNRKYIKLALPWNQVIKYSNLVHNELPRSRRLSKQRQNEAVIKFRKNIVDKYVISEQQRAAITEQHYSEDHRKVSISMWRRFSYPVARKVSHLVVRNNKNVPSKNSNITRNISSFFNKLNLLRWITRLLSKNTL